MNKLILVLIYVTMTLMLLNEGEYFIAQPLRKLKKYVDLTKVLISIEHPLNLVYDVFIKYRTKKADNTKPHFRIVAVFVE